MTSVCPACTLSTKPYGIAERRICPDPGTPSEYAFLARGFFSKPVQSVAELVQGSKMDFRLPHKVVGRTPEV